MEKKTYFAPAIEDMAMETEEMIAVSVGNLSFDGEGGSTELQDSELEEGIGGLVRSVVIFED